MPHASGAAALHLGTLNRGSRETLQREIDRRRSGWQAEAMKQVGRLLAPLAAILLLLIVWQLYSTLSGAGNDLLPAPSRVVSAGWADRSSLWDNLQPTVLEVLLGFAVSLLFAFLLSIILDRSQSVRRALTPVLIGSQTLPIIVLAPLVVIWFGFGIGPKVLLVALVTFFPLLVGLLEGYGSTQRDAMTLMKTMGAGWWTTYRLLRLPSALPSFFTGLRISITYAVVAAIFAEYAGAELGLGIYMQSAKASFRTDLVLAAVLISAALTLCLYALTFALQRLMMPWYAQSRAGSQ